MDYSSDLYADYEDNNAILHPYQGSETSADLSEYINELRALSYLVSKRMHSVGRLYDEAIVREQGHPLQIIKECEMAPVPDFDIDADYSKRILFTSNNNTEIAPGLKRSVLTISFNWQPRYVYNPNGSQQADPGGRLTVQIQSDLPRRFSSSAHGKFNSKVEAIRGFETIYKRALKNFKKGYKT